MTIKHNVDEIPIRMHARADALESNVQGFLRELAQRIDRGATQRLSGAGGPGSYPVPRRTGNLARQQGHSVGRRQAVVWNAAPYARAIHQGFHPFGNPNAPWMPGRPFLSDAIEAVKPLDLLQNWMGRQA